MKKILCILLAVVTCMVSTLTAWAGVVNNEPQMVQVSREIFLLDKEYSVEITDYEYLPNELSVCSTTSSKTYLYV